MTEVQQLAQIIKEKAKTDLIFDMDKTLLKLGFPEDISQWHQGVAKIISQYDPAYRYDGGKVWHLVNASIEKYGSEIRDQIWNFNEEYEQRVIKGYEPYDELIALARAHTGKRYLFTSNSRSTAEAVLKELNLFDLWDAIVTRDEVQLVKPSTEGMKYIYEQGRGKADYIMMGDSKPDRGLAQNFGIDFFQIDRFNQ